MKKKKIYININSLTLQIICTLIGFLITSCSIKNSPIATKPLQASEAISQISEPSLQKVAVMLPLSGNFATSGKAVREGFLAAYYESKKYGQPDLSITFEPTDIKFLFPSLNLSSPILCKN